jgi:serine/threonine protein kinase
VWLARDRHLDREVALKELRPEKAGNNTIAARFLRRTFNFSDPVLYPSVARLSESC